MIGYTDMFMESFHPWEFVPMQKSFHFGECTVIPDEFITDGCGERALAGLSNPIEYLEEAGCVFLGADELADAFLTNPAVDNSFLTYIYTRTESCQPAF